MKRKTEITFEIEEVTFFKARKCLTGFCGFCGETVEIITVETAALILGFCECQIFRLIESGGVHFAEGEKVYICRKSLEACAGNLKSSFEGLGTVLTFPRVTNGERG